MGNTDLSRRGVPEDSPCLSLQALQNLRAGSGSNHDKQHIENCPMCADALEGLAASSNQDQFDAAMADLNRRLEQQTQPVKVSSGNLRMIAVAAALALLMMIPVFNWLSGPSTDDLFVANFQPYPNTVSLVRDTTELTPLQQAMTRYEAKDYQQALTALKDLLPGDPSNQQIRFYTGVSFLSAGQAENALGALAPLLILSESEWYQPAQWYSALAYLKLGQTKKAQILLKSLAGSEEFGSRADTILQALE